MDSLFTLSLGKTKLRTVLNLLTNHLFCAVSFSNFRADYCCHIPVLGILSSTSGHHRHRRLFFLHLVRMRKKRKYISSFAAASLRIQFASEIQKQQPEVFCKKRCSQKFFKIHKKTPVPESLF